MGILLRFGKDWNAEHGRVEYTCDQCGARATAAMLLYLEGPDVPDVLQEQGWTSAYLPDRTLVFCTPACKSRSMPPG